MAGSKWETAGKVAGGGFFVVGGFDWLAVSWEYAVHDVDRATFLAVLGAVAIGAGIETWRLAASFGAPAEPPVDDSSLSAYERQWVEGIGWVPVQPYDPEGPR